LVLVLVLGPRRGRGLVIARLLVYDLVRVATDPRGVASGWVADYVFVERGFEFFAAHAEAFPDADTPAVSIDSPSIALTHILDHGGSCYLSRSTIIDLLGEGRLFEVASAPKSPPTPLSFGRMRRRTPN
ncbi:MAG: hypothetical protein VX606_09175, partial [Pseudomonadota bacterium]|nr:hypothetical protein [Pseudomonadota bacterium]